METTMTIIAAATNGASLAALIGICGLCLFIGAAVRAERETRTGLVLADARGTKSVDWTRGRAYPRHDAPSDVPAACRSRV